MNLNRLVMYRGPCHPLHIRRIKKTRETKGVVMQTMLPEIIRRVITAKWPGTNMRPSRIKWLEEELLLLHIPRSIPTPYIFEPDRIVSIVNRRITYYEGLLGATS